MDKELPFAPDTVETPDRETDGAVVIPDAKSEVEAPERAVSDTQNADCGSATNDESASDSSDNSTDKIDAKNGDAVPSGTEKLKSYEELKREQKKKKLLTILGYVAFIIINAVIITVFAVVENKKGDTTAGEYAFRKLGENWPCTLSAFSMFFIVVLFDTAVFYFLIRHTGDRKKLGLSVKVSFLGRYYDRITPWAMGGEPFQIAYLIQGGLSGSDAGAVTMSRHIVRFFTTAIAVIIILAVSGIATNVWVMAAAIAGVLGGLAVPIFMIICCVKPRLGQKIGEFVIKLLYKIKIVKDRDKQTRNMQIAVDNFLRGIKYLGSDKKLIAVIALSALAELFCVNSVPFFIIRALGHPEITYWKTLVLCIFVTYASSFAPTPGGAGIAELSFYAIFASFISGGYLFWSVLFWRIAIFFVPVAIGFVMQTVDSIRSIVKTVRNSRY